MKLYYATQLEDHAGEPLKSGADPKNPNQKAILGEVCVEALIRDLQNEENAPGAKKMHRWSLAKKIQNGVKEFRKAEENEDLLPEDSLAIELPSEDITLIKDRIAKVFGTGVMGPAYIAIEQS